MQEITKIYKVYAFDELTEKAKQAAMTNLLDVYGDDLNMVFYEYCMDRLNTIFPCSEPKIEYSLSYCQGDGLNIYGCFAFTDLYRYVQHELTAKEQKFVKWVIKEFNLFNYYVDLPMNPWRYTYCVIDRANIIGEILQDVENAAIYKNFKTEVLFKFERLVIEYITTLCYDLKRVGYDMLYDVSGYVNECEYLADGTIFEY